MFLNLLLVARFRSSWRLVVKETHLVRIFEPCKNPGANRQINQVNEQQLCAVNEPLSHLFSSSFSLFPNYRKRTKTHKMVLADRVRAREREHERRRVHLLYVLLATVTVRGVTIPREQHTFRIR